MKREMVLVQQVQVGRSEERNGTGTAGTGRQK